MIKKTLCNKCEYEWISRVEKPKSCPRCKGRFDSKKINLINKLIAWAGNGEFVYEDNIPDESFSNDGLIHIVRNGQRYVGGLGQEVTKVKWVVNARKIAKEFGISKKESQKWIDKEYSHD